MQEGIYKNQLYCYDERANNMKKIFLSGSSNPQLAKKICQKANGQSGKIEISRFYDGEISIFIEEKLKDRDVFIVQSTSSPVQENIIELILIADAARRMEAKTINIIIPYFGYARKERISRNGEPISAKVIANLIETIRPNRIVTVDLHTPVIQGFFETPLINLLTNQILIQEIKKLNLKNLVIVSPDIGGAKRARSFAEILKCPVAIIEKKRFIDQQDKSEVLTIIGNVSQKNIVIVDDLISTGSTIFKATELLKKEGGRKVYVAVTHVVMRDILDQKLIGSLIEKVLTTDSISFTASSKSKKIKTVSLDKLIAGELV